MKIPHALSDACKAGVFACFRALPGNPRCEPVGLGVPFIFGRGLRPESSDSNAIFGSGITAPAIRFFNNQPKRPLSTIITRLRLPGTASLLLLLAGANPAPAQTIGLGIEGGARVSNEVFGDITSESKRYIVGPRLDVHLPHNFFIEIEALYRTFGFTAYNSSAVTSEITHERANSWEVPLLLKYRFPKFVAHPFLGAGYAPRFVHGKDLTNGAYASGVTSGVVTYTYLINQQSTTNYPVSHGAVVSGGVDFAAGPVHIAPELRYIHWSPAFLNVNQSGAAGPYRINSAHNELLILFGVTWH